MTASFLNQSGEFQAAFDTLNTFIQAVYADARCCCVLIGVGEVSAQTGNTDLQVSQAVHDFFQLALDTVLSSLKAFQMFQYQVFGVFHGGKPLWVCFIECRRFGGLLEGLPIGGSRRRLLPANR